MLVLREELQANAVNGRNAESASTERIPTKPKTEILWCIKLNYVWSNGTDY